jgi:hypothetical protein
MNKYLSFKSKNASRFKIHTIQKERRKKSLKQNQKKTAIKNSLKNIFKRFVSSHHC